MLSKIKYVCALEACGMLSPKHRRYWVHPFHCVNDGFERFNSFYLSIRQYPTKFFEFYRMSIESFDELLEVLSPYISKKSTTIRSSISAEERLTITLRFLSTGISFASLQYEFYRGRSTIAEIVRETCHKIWIYLKQKEMPEPTTDMWKNIAEDFYKKTNFPNCVGALDGKHIRCINPQGGGSNFFNYKKFVSLVLMALVDSNLKFTAIDVGAYGKEGDSPVFKESALGKKLYSRSLNLPPPSSLPNVDRNPQPFVIVADEAFQLSTNLLTPFPSRNLTARRRVYNYRHCRCRRTFECAFGVLANKWRIFHTPILVEPKFIDDIVKACCILHNFVRQRDGMNLEDTEAHPFEDIRNFGTSSRGKGSDVRNEFADYFMGTGAVPFQRNYMY